MVPASAAEVDLHRSRGLHHRQGSASRSHRPAVGLLSESLNPGLNRVASAHPASEALQDLGLGNDLLESENPMKAAKAWHNPDPSGKYKSHVLPPE